MSRIVDFLDVSNTSEILDYMVGNASFENQTMRHSGKARQRGEEDRSSQIRKGVVGDWKNHMSETLGAVVDDAVGELRKMVFDRYDVDTVWN